MAMKALIVDFLKIPDLLIQSELLSAMQCSNHFSLIHPLKDLLKYHAIHMSDSLIEEVEDTISTLSLVSRKIHSFQSQTPQFDSSG